MGNPQVLESTPLRGKVEVKSLLSLLCSVARRWDLLLHPVLPTTMSSFTTSPKQQAHQSHTAVSQTASESKSKLLFQKLFPLGYLLYWWKLTRHLTTHALHFIIIKQSLPQKCYRNAFRVINRMSRTKWKWTDQIVRKEIIQIIIAFSPRMTVGTALNKKVLKLTQRSCQAELPSRVRSVPYVCSLCSTM